MERCLCTLFLTLTIFYDITTVIAQEIDYGRTLQRPNKLLGYNTRQTYNRHSRYTEEEYGKTLQRPNKLSGYNARQIDNRPSRYTEEVHCQMPHVSNGEVFVSKGESGQVAVYSCHKGYKLSGPNLRYCISGGIWSDEEPSCDAEDTDKLAYGTPCPELSLDHGEVLIKTMDSEYVAEFKCLPGYKIVGNHLIRCNMNGQWSNKTPKCKYSLSQRVLSYLSKGKVAKNAEKMHRKVVSTYEKSGVANLGKGKLVAEEAENMQNNAQSAYKRRDLTNFAKKVTNKAIKLRKKAHSYYNRSILAELDRGVIHGAEILHKSVGEAYERSPFAKGGKVAKKVENIHRQGHSDYKGSELSNLAGKVAKESEKMHKVQSIYDESGLPNLDNKVKFSNSMEEVSRPYSKSGSSTSLSSMSDMIDALQKKIEGAYDNLQPFDTSASPSSSPQDIVDTSSNDEASMKKRGGISSKIRELAKLKKPKKSSKKEMTCSQLTVENGNIMYSKQGKKKTAVYKCDAGYHIHGPMERICENGKWSGEEPTCTQSVFASKWQNYRLHSPGQTVTLICELDNPKWSKFDRPVDKSILKNSFTIQYKADAKEFFSTFMCEGTRLGRVQKLIYAVYIGEQDDSRIYPKNAGQDVGGKITMECDGTSITYFYGDCSGNIYWEAASKSNKLIIEKAVIGNDLTHCGYFYCFGLIPGPTSKRFIAHTRFFVFDNQYIHPQHQLAPIKSTATIQCDSDYSTQWNFDGKGTPTNIKLKIEQEVKIVGVNQGNRGYYICIGTKNLTGHFMARSLFQVIYQAKLRPPNHVLSVGESGIFKCYSKYPVQWLFNNEVILPGNVMLGESKEKKNVYWLAVSDARDFNIGTYQCVSENDNIIYESIGEISVVGPDGLLQDKPSPKVLQNATQDCPVLYVDDGVVMLTNEDNKKVALYKCSSGFTITSGSAKRYCENGQWSGEEPKCQQYASRFSAIHHRNILIYYAFCSFTILIITLQS